MIRPCLLAAIAATVPLGALAFDEDDFATCAFVLNEDWYGHQNSTINAWYPDNTDDPYNPVFYRVFQYKNPGCELGCTSQYAQIFGGRMYIMSKQHKDPGARIRGGRITVADASTMEMLVQHDVINPDGTALDGGTSAGGVVTGTALGDGRCCVGVTPDKVYLGTSNGIYVMTVPDFRVTSRIAGTENVLITGDENNIDGQGPLYQNQIGMMLRTQDYVLAIMQDRGVLAIDPVTDAIVHEIPGCFSTMVQAADGSIWVGENLADPAGTNAFGVSYTHYPYGDNGSEWRGNGLLRIDPATLETRRVTLPAASGAGVPQSWYAWTAGKLAASAHRNVLYFTYIDPSEGQASWFSDSRLYRYDIDRDKVEMIYDSSEDDLWFYSSSLRVDPVTDKLYAHFYVGDNIASKNWVYRRFVDEGDRLVEDAAARLIANYWYPAMFIFPDTARPVVSGMPSAVTLAGAPVTIPLADKVTARDTPSVAIVKRITANTDPAAVSAAIVRGELVLTPGTAPGDSQVTVCFDSNGHTADAVISVTNTAAAVTEFTTDDIRLFVEPDCTISLAGLPDGCPVELYDTVGRCLLRTTASGVLRIPSPGTGLYVIRAGNKFVRKINL